MENLKVSLFVSLLNLSVTCLRPRRQWPDAHYGFCCQWAGYSVVSCCPLPSGISFNQFDPFFLALGGFCTSIVREEAFPRSMEWEQEKCSLGVRLLCGQALWMVR
jgi:hypothetical protein